MRRSGLIQRIAAAGLCLTTATACKSLDVDPTAATKVSARTQTVNAGIFAVKKTTSRLIGADEFCREAKGNCLSVDALNAKFKTSAQAVDEIALFTVNAEVNGGFEAQTDKDIYGLDEKWAYPVTAADCEDYALEKRKRLLEMGMPAQNMAIVMVKQSNGEGHAILLAKLGDKIYQLDNMDSDINAYENNDRGYQYLKWSSNIWNWYEYNKGPAPSVTATAQP